ncbi:MAG: endopeptidase La [Proteobacteria bacterium]|nr:endopeptidase La [Pseudomonadota bacterium]MBU1714830.1 endopeptidase La [Pseudomonadota bacterium]
MGLFGNWQGHEDREDGERLLEIADLRESVDVAKLPALVEKVALKEIERLVKTSSSATEYTIGINYLEYLTSLPWNFTTEDNLDLAHALHILNEEHYGLENIKERILEYLAVRKLKLAGRHKVLVVDDEKVARRNMEHVLTKDGYDVTTVAGGVEALKLLDTQRFDLIVTDLKMAAVDGMEVLEKAKSADHTVEVIMVSGYATTPTTVEAMKKGSYYFLAKPLQLEELRTTVRTALQNKKTRFGVKGPILCFVGPPGTGKTSLQKSIARCLGRKFIRISLGGMKDEAEIRGHRRSYVGALPGRIIQEIRRAGSKNPLVMLDEIDKIGQDFKGDPASALLEVLDHTQNSHFIDHYLDVPFDLSQVMFIATANTTDPIPAPLLDRMEIIYLSGYTEEEKEQIAENFLVPRGIEEAGLTDNPPELTPPALRKIIRDYTREAGLRGLQGQIAAICRKLARKVLDSESKNPFSITPTEVEHLLGPRRYFFEVAEEREMVGVSTGLALTESGGQIIFVEAIIMKGKEQLIMTGSLGGIMKESAQAALSYVRSKAAFFNIPEDFFEGHDIHIHIPAGAIPKDGPSAGLTIAVSLISLLTRRPVKRDVAMTGELTLSGRILPVGGVKGKILAARRAGITRVILPLRNEADLYDIPENVTRDIEIIVTDEIEKIIDLALTERIM